MATKKATKAEPEAAEVEETREVQEDLWFPKNFGKPWEGGGVYEKHMHYVHVGEFCEECNVPLYSNRNKPFNATELLKEQGGGLALYEPNEKVWYCHEHAPDGLLYETIGDCAVCSRMTFIVRTDKKVEGAVMHASEHAHHVGDSFGTVVRTAKGEPPMMMCGEHQPYAVHVPGDGDKRIAEMQALAKELGMPVKIAGEVGQEKIHRPL